MHTENPGIMLPFTLFPMLLLLSFIRPTFSTNTTEKPRIFILSDILNEPDDSQSLVRYLLYSNEFQTEGIVATTSTWLPNETHPEAIREIIRACGSVVDNLNQHVPEDKQYSSAEELLGVVFSGPTVYGKQALQNNTTPSPGTIHLIKSLKSSTAILHLPIWAGTNTLAQALQHITRTHSPTEAKALRSRLRIYTISDQDDTGPWLRATYPDLFYIASRHAWKAYSLATWTGMSTTGLSPAANDSIVQNEWLGGFIQKGELGSVYPDIEYTMEGDSPSLLYFIPNGLGHVERPEWGSWGGRYTRLSDDSHETQFGDTIDTVYYTSGNKTETEKSNHATIFRWRNAFQTDFAARMQWTLSPDYTSARHPPVIRVNGHEGLEPLIIHARLNQSFIFDASETIDTDQHDDLQFEWYQYQEPSYLPNPGPQSDEKLNIQPLSDGQLVKLNSQGFTDAVRAKKVRVTLPATQDAEMVDGYHLILQVSTGGEVPFTRYKRVVLVV